MQQQQPNDGPTIRGSFNLFYVLASAHARCVTPFGRDRAGGESSTLPGPIAVVGMLAYGGLVNDGRVLTYIGMWVIALVFQRCDSLLCCSRGMLIHSHYAGRPYAAMLLAPFIKDEATAKLIVEPLICLASAWMLADWSPAVAKLVGYAGVSIIIVELIDRHMRHQREQSVINARLEMQDLASGVRQRIGY